MRCVELVYIHPRALVLCRDFRDGKYVYSLHLEPAEEWRASFGVSGRKIAEFSSPNESEALDRVVEHLMQNIGRLGFSMKTLLHHMIYKLATR